MAADPAVPSLADVLAEHCFTEHYMTCECRVTTDWSHETMGIGEWAEHVEAEYWASRRVTTVEQLDALPTEAVYMASHEIALAEQKHGEVWLSAGNTDPFEPGLPGRVLWLPGEGEQP